MSTVDRAALAHLRGQDSGVTCPALSVPPAEEAGAPAPLALSWAGGALAELKGRLLFWSRLHKLSNLVSCKR